jgi:transposase
LDVAGVIGIYRSKDVVEKGFMRLKNSLDLARLRVFGGLAVQSKVFVCFVALVLLSYVHNVMVDKGLYKVYTLRLLMKVLSKRRVQTIGEDRIEYPVTKEQREIYSAFGF